MQRNISIVLEQINLGDSRDHGVQRLPRDAQIRIDYNGKRVTALKRDI